MFEAKAMQTHFSIMSSFCLYQSGNESNYERVPNAWDLIKYILEDFEYFHDQI